MDTLGQAAPDRPPSCQACPGHRGVQLPPPPTSAEEPLDGERSGSQWPLNRGQEKVPESTHQPQLESVPRWVRRGRKLKRGVRGAGPSWARR